MACDRRRDMRQALRARFIQRFPSSRKSAMKGVQMANRPKLTIEDQVAYMKNKGITFDHCSEKDAVRFLQESTYFFIVKRSIKITLLIQRPGIIIIWTFLISWSFQP